MKLKKPTILRLHWAIFIGLIGCVTVAADAKPPNVLFIISDDLTSTALGCYGNEVCQTPNIDKLAAEGTRFTSAYCQATICGPSRASFMFGYYPYASKANGYTSGHEKVGPDKDSWAQHFKKNGYHSARISKVFHMGVPPDITKGSDGADDPKSWDEAYNSKGPEVKTPGLSELLSNNPGGVKKGTGSSQSFSVVEADGDDLVHSDGKTAQKAVELIGIFTSDHGYHLGEHELWQKVSIHEESAKVPLIIRVPGKKPAVCNSFVELLDLYPSTAKLCGLAIPRNLQGKDVTGMFDNPSTTVRDAVLTSGKGQLYRTDHWAYLSYGRAAELYDMHKDPKQYVNLVNNPEYATVLAQLQKQLKNKLENVSKHDLTPKKGAH